MPNWSIQEKTGIFSIEKQMGYFDKKKFYTWYVAADKA